MRLKKIYTAHFPKKGFTALTIWPFVCKFDTTRSYMSISFEQEAYEHEAETYYNEVRRHYAWLRYLFTLY